LRLWLGVRRLLCLLERLPLPEPALQRFAADVIDRQRSLRQRQQPALGLRVVGPEGLQCRQTAPLNASAAFHLD
jgi:hypothetical protein